MSGTPGYHDWHAVIVIWINAQTYYKFLKNEANCFGDPFMYMIQIFPHVCYTGTMVLLTSIHACQKLFLLFHISITHYFERGQ